MTEWREGWYRTVLPDGAVRVGYYKKGQYHGLEDSIKRGNQVDYVHLVSDDELAAMVTDAVQVYLKYQGVEEFVV